MGAGPESHDRLAGLEVKLDQTKLIRWKREKTSVENRDISLLQSFKSGDSFTVFFRIVTGVEHRGLPAKRIELAGQRRHCFVWTIVVCANDKQCMGFRCLHLAKREQCREKQQ